MREIKFRAWDGEQMRGFEGIFNDRPYIERSTFVQYESIPEYLKLELMQYTGLKDKNGVEIYEGDILASESDGSGDVDVWERFVMGAVYWDDEFACWGHKIALNDDESVYSPPYVSVIGNIHENPELLTV